jgi:hypothetical protein
MSAGPATPELWKQNRCIASAAYRATRLAFLGWQTPRPN